MHEWCLVGDFNLIVTDNHPGRSNTPQLADGAHRLRDYTDTRNVVATHAAYHGA